MIQLKVVQDLRLDSGQRYTKNDVVSPSMSEAAWLLTKYAKHFTPEGEEATELNRKLKAGAFHPQKNINTPLQLKPQE